MGKQGGVSGEVKFPDYIEDFHKDIMNGSAIPSGSGTALTPDLYDEINSLVSVTSPYEDSTNAFTSPTTDLKKIEARLDNVTSIIDGLIPTTDWNAFASHAAAAITSPIFRAVTDGAVATIRSGADDDFIQSFDMFSTSIIFGAPTTEWETALAHAVSYVDNTTNGVLQGIPITSFFNELRTSGVEAVTSAVNALLATVALPNMTSEWQSLIDISKVQYDLASYIVSIDFVTTFPVIYTRQTANASTEVASAIADAGTVTSPVPVTDVEAYIDSGISKNTITPTTDWDGFSDKVISAENFSTYVNKMTYSTLVNAMQLEVTAEVSDSIDKAKLAAEDAAGDTLTTIVAEALDAVSTELLTTLATKIDDSLASVRASKRRRFGATMADINSIQSSNFLLGLAALESEEGRRAEEVLADRMMGIYSSMVQGIYQTVYQAVYTSVLGLRVEYLTRLVNSNVQAEGINLGADQVVLGAAERFRSGGVSAQVQLEGLKTAFVEETARLEAGLRGSKYEGEIRQFLGKLNLRERFLSTLIGGDIETGRYKLEADRSNQATEADFLLRHTLAQIDLRRIKAEIQQRQESEQYDVWKRAYTSGAPESMRAKIQEKVSREAILSQALQDMFRLILATVEGKLATSELYLNHLRTKYLQEFRKQAFNSAERHALLKESQRIMTQMLGERSKYQLQSVQSLGEALRLLVVARREYEESNLEFEVRGAYWDLDALLMGSQGLSAITGSQYVPRAPSKSQSAIGGAMQGAALGASVGSAVPGLGTAAGAIVGLGLGALQGLT